ncbi:hypothetical protein HanIR_Chr16g0843791 [Helianthus annuus]|nr:hypothetical protein HanIR_Chr16g0843791 [Helianthus annuus]
MLLKFNIDMEDYFRVIIGDGRNTHFWSDRWHENGKLKDLFPELYRNSASKTGSVAEFCGNRDGFLQWGWDWLREPQSNREWEQISSLKNLLQQVRLTQGKDKWFWVNDLGVDFSIKNIRNLIMSHGASASFSSQFVWNGWATSKSNFITWRARMGKVPTKLELSLRGIWWNIFVWVRIPLPDNINSVASLLDVINKAPGSKKWKKLVNTVMKATFWRIWYARNQKVFEGKVIRVIDSVEQIKEDSFLWIKHRSNLPAVSWEDWLDFNVSSLL